MSTIIETLRQAVNTLSNLPLLIAVAVGLLLLGWLLKAFPAFPNRYIPAAVVVVGGVVGFFVIPMQGPADWAFNVADPAAADRIRRVCIGLALGFGAWALHKVALRKAEDWLKTKLSVGDTAFVEKPPAGK